MASIEEIRKERLAKRDALARESTPAYPGSSRRTHAVREAHEQFASLTKQEREVILAGRVRSMRGHGGSVFLHVEDASGSMQAYLKRDRMGEEAYASFLDAADIGDIIQVRGILFTTKKGEETLLAADAKILAKSIRPLPDKWHGLQDTEERLRRRYLDLLMNREVRHVFELRCRIVRAIRSFLDRDGYVEVETPVLQQLYGGAEARPFTTHHNALDMDLYLRISLELYLKRLLVGGFEKVYEIGRNFRNEGIDRSHNPEFTMLEFYWAYADYKDMMRKTEELLQEVVGEVFGGLSLAYEGRTLDFSGSWPRVEYAALIRREAGVDIESASRDALFEKARELGVPADPGWEKARLADEIYKKHVRPRVWEPTFVIHHPVGTVPLAKPLDGDPEHLAMFQLVCAGWELVKAYSEMNDPVAQRAAFEEQERMFRKGLGEAHRLDEDFLEALEYGMPPAAGFGMGIDRLCALLTGVHSLRDAMLFPMMKPKP